MPAEYYPVLIALAIALGLGAVIIVASELIGRRRGGRTKLSTYESGLPLLDRSRKRLSIAFFLVALDFVVFDVETAFLYPWALVLRDGGWPLFAAMMVFVALLTAGLVYVWRKGGLEVAPAPRRSSR